VRLSSSVTSNSASSLSAKASPPTTCGSSTSWSTLSTNDNTSSTTAEPGVGKTCALRALRRRLPEAGYRGLESKATAAGVFYAISSHVEELSRERVHPVVLLDESHLLRQEVLDHLHVLSNYHWDAKPLLSLFSPSSSSAFRSCRTVSSSPAIAPCGRASTAAFASKTHPTKTRRVHLSPPRTSRRRAHHLRQRCTHHDPRSHLRSPPRRRPPRNTRAQIRSQTEAQSRRPRRRPRAPRRRLSITDVSAATKLSGWSPR
jgi:hypothetical protein